MSKGIWITRPSLVTQESEGKFVKEDSEQRRARGSHWEGRPAADHTLLPKTLLPGDPVAGFSRLQRGWAEMYAFIAM